MINLEYFREYEKYKQEHLEEVVKRIKEISCLNNKPVRILDLATGPNQFNPLIVKKLIYLGIDFELLLSDISPTGLKRGYANLERVLNKEDMAKISCILVDSNDLKKDLVKIPLYTNSGNIFKSLRRVLEMPEFNFLLAGYEKRRKKENFENESFDLVLGIIPYSSMEENKKAIRESVRILKKEGYHIVSEWQIQKINLETYRTESAMRGAKIRNVDKIKEEIDSLITPVRMLTNLHKYQVEYYDSDECVQNGDIVEDCVFVHKK